MWVVSDNLEIKVVTAESVVPQGFRDSRDNRDNLVQYIKMNWPQVVTIVTKLENNRVTTLQVRLSRNARS